MSKEIEVKMEKSVEEINAKIVAAGELPIDRWFYFNGFALTVSATDISILAQYNNQVIAQFTATHTIAKTLMVKLSNAIIDFEKKTGTQILVLDELSEKFEEEAKKQTGKKDSP